LLLSHLVRCICYYKVRNIYEPEKDEVRDSLGNSRGNEAIT